MVFSPPVASIQIWILLLPTTLWITKNFQDCWLYTFTPIFSRLQLHKISRRLSIGIIITDLIAVNIPIANNQFSINFLSFLNFHMLHLCYKHPHDGYRCEMQHGEQKWQLIWKSHVRAQFAMLLSNFPVQDFVRFREIKTHAEYITTLENFLSPR